MRPSARGWLLFLALVAASLVADLASKEAIFARLGMPGLGGRVVLVPEILVLETNLNEGALFGMGQGLGMLLRGSRASPWRASWRWSRDRPRGRAAGSWWRWP